MLMLPPSQPNHREAQRVMLKNKYGPSVTFSVWNDAELVRQSLGFQARSIWQKIAWTIDVQGPACSTRSFSCLSEVTPPGLCCSLRPNSSVKDLGEHRVLHGWGLQLTHEVNVRGIHKRFLSCSSPNY